MCNKSSAWSGIRREVWIHELVKQGKNDAKITWLMWGLVNRFGLIIVIHSSWHAITLNSQQIGFTNYGFYQSEPSSKTFRSVWKCHSSGCKKMFLNPCLLHCLSEESKTWISVLIINKLRTYSSGCLLNTQFVITVGLSLRPKRSKTHKLKGLASKTQPW